MTRAYVQDGATMDFTTTGAVTNGEVLEFTNAIGVALAAASGASQVIPVAMEGVYLLAKETGVAFTVGQKLYWDTVNNRLDATNTNVAAGIAWAPAASADTTALVRINFGAPQ
jgi:predicted RecA/RadA family phage recombinase